MADIKVDISGLEHLAKALGDDYSIKVGIVGETAQRHNGNTDKTNAEIGFINEFGKQTGFPKIPARSFLRMPLTLYLSKYLRDKKSLSKQAVNNAVKSGKLLELAKKVGLVAEEVIQEAFATRGFGNWAPNAPYTIAQKGSDSPLIDTGELRRSITSRVEKK